MRGRFLIAVGIVAAAAVAAGGCYLNDPRSSAHSVGNPLAPMATAARPDSNPGGPPPRPPRPPRLSVQFAGSDSVAAGQTSNTRWRFGNGGHSSLTVAWTLTDEQGWPSLPRQGTLNLAPLSTQSLVVPVAVPDSTLTGIYILHMAATAGNNLNATANGAIRVSGPDSTGAGKR